MDIGDSRALISERVTNLMQLQVVVVALLRRRWVCMRINMLFSQLLSIFPLSSSLPFSLQIWTPFFGPTILESRHRESLLSPCRNLLKSRALQSIIFCKWQTYFSKIKYCLPLNLGMDSCQIPSIKILYIVMMGWREREGRIHITLKSQHRVLDKSFP